jgi:hypothetical protein
VLANTEAQTRQLLTVGKWLLAVSVPLMGGWITAAATDKTDVFGKPFWVIAVMVVSGIVFCVRGAEVMPISRPRKGRHRRPGVANYSIALFKCVGGLGLSTAVVVEEVALGVTFFLVFTAIIGT